MSDSQNTEPYLDLQKFYLRDVSFESPNVPQVFQENWETDLNFELNTSYRTLSENTYEVSLKLSAKVQIKDKLAFLVEVDQAGIFVVHNFPKEQLEHILNSYCPNILFPYAREAISDLTTKGGFPPLLLAPINFDALYAQKIKEQKNQKPADVDNKGSDKELRH